MGTSWSNKRISYPVEGAVSTTFDRATNNALEMAQELPDIHGSVLTRLLDLKPMVYGGQESEGATYSQLGFIAHRVGMDEGQRTEWYRIARKVPLSARHASHIAARITDDSLEESRELETLWGSDTGEPPGW